MAGSDTDSEYDTPGAPGPSTKKKLRTEIVHKKCVTTYSREDFKRGETQSTDNESQRQLPKMAKVKVAQGWLEGAQLELATGDGKYFSFKGIPYAAPPIEKLRFKAPVPPKSWDGVKKATEHGSVCYQKDVFSGEIVPGSEDCLYLNVYTPDLKPATPMVVMAYIHGGGFASGSGDDDMYGPDFLVQHNVILVTINYRLDALGFLCMDTEEVPGNAGMKDQVAALEWIRENIANFGGDPHNVTIFGESAGGASVSMHVMSPMSRGLFNRGIAMSGTALCDWAMPFEPRRRAFALGKRLGLDSEDPNELLEFLQKVPVEDLIDRNPCILASEEITRSEMKMFHFVPVVEKDFGQRRFLTDQTIEALKNKRVNDVDVMIGYTDGEIQVGIPILENGLMERYERYNEMLVPQKILHDCSQLKVLEIADMIRKRYFGNKNINLDAMKEFVKYGSDATFYYQMNKFARELAENIKSKVYFYQFSCVSERNVFGQLGAKYGLSGASHLDDCMYLFNAKKFDLPVDKSSPSYKMIQQTCALFSNFAKYGNPTPEPVNGLVWPVFDSARQSYLDIGEKLTPGTAPNADADKFWKTVYEVAGVMF